MKLDHMHIVRPVRRRLLKLLRNTRGMAAVEFALIFPVMIIIYFGAVEIGQVLTLNRKLTNIASATADLVTQETAIDDDMMTDIFTAASSMIVPYEAAPTQIVVSSVVSDPGDGSISVDWSDAHNGSARSPGSAVTIPNGLLSPGESLILTEVSYSYDSILNHFIQDGYTLTDTFYLRPRRTQQISRE